MSSSFVRLWIYARRHQRTILIGLSCALVAAAISVMSPWILKYTIDDLQRGVTAEKLRFYAGLMLVVAFFNAVFRFFMRRILLSAARVIEYYLRNDAFAHFERWSLADFQQFRTGDLLSRTTNDVAAVRMMVAPAVMYAVFTSLLFVVTVALMLSLSAWLTLLALLPLPLIILSVRYFGAAIQRSFGPIQAQLAEISTLLLESLTGARVVRAYGQEPHELRQFREANSEFVARNRRLVRLQALFQPTLRFLLGLASLLVLWIGSREVIAGRMTTGEFVAFMAYLAMLSFPIQAFGWITNLLQRGMASWKRMLELLESSATITDRDAIPQLSRAAIRGAVRFNALNFSYQAAHKLPGQDAADDALRLTLQDVSFEIEPGQTLGIVGPTGSGKSTLVQLTARLHDPPPGTVFVDDIDVRQLPLSVLRGVIGFVPQEPFIFSDTLAANIVFGADEATAPRGRDMHWAAGVARLDKDIPQLPKGFDTVVGERGITLSRGQKQRAALARALMVDPRILVLDDALSAVDTLTEAEILQRLRAVRSERTSLIVSHRVSTVRDADLILVLDEGRIVERGTHRQLVELGGAYAELHRKQLLEEQLAAS